MKVERVARVRGQSSTGQRAGKRNVRQSRGTVGGGKPLELRKKRGPGNPGLVTLKKLFSSDFDRRRRRRHRRHVRLADHRHRHHRRPDVPHGDVRR